MTIPLPTPENNSGSADWSDVYSNDNKLKEELEATQEDVAAVTGFKWYTPKVIATEQSTSSTSFTTLSTADEISSVVVPENGIVILRYAALVKCSSGGFVGKAAIFIGSNQLKMRGTAAPEANIASVDEAGVFETFFSAPEGLRNTEAGTSFVTTGMAFGSTVPPSYPAGACEIFGLSAGTYTISVKYKAESGTVTAKERKLWVATLG